MVVSAIPACLRSNSERVTKLLIMMLVFPKGPWPPVNLVHSQLRQIALPARLDEVLLYQCVRDVYISQYVFIKHVKIYKMATKIIYFEITVNKWKKSKQMEFLGIPTYWGSGLTESNGTRYCTWVRLIILHHSMSTLCHVIFSHSVWISMDKK